MVEHIHPHDLGGKHVVFKMPNPVPGQRDVWYKIPFFILEDLVDVWYDDNIQNGAAHHYDLLEKWLDDWKFSWKTEAIEQIKCILKDEVPALIAFQIPEDNNGIKDILDEPK